MAATPRFEYFVILAEMRTGSNLLETCLNEIDAISCLGEAFNPHFIGHPKTEALLGSDRAARDNDPMALLHAIRSQPGLAGFRYFHDHDARVLEPVMRDPSCAKIVLTRNPLDSYVSLKIARATQQWRLGDVTNRKVEKVVFDPVEFEAHVAGQQAFQLRLQSLLQTTGQSAFYISYEDIQDIDVLNGLARWLGSEGQIKALPKRLKRQNPEALEDKLVNPEAVSEGIARTDRFNLSRSPSFEPRHPPPLWAYRACRTQPLVYAPIPGCVERDILGWMGRIDGTGPRELLSDFTRESWRDWQRMNSRRMAFSVLRHPLARAHEVFLRQLVLGNRVNVRNFLARVHGVEMPEDEAGLARFDTDSHRRAFLAFLQFVRANLNGQTALPIRPIWASQSRLIEGITAQCPLHRLLREEHLAHDLPALGQDLGCVLPAFTPSIQRPVLELATVYDAGIEAAGRAAYGRDYETLGFGDWRAA